MKNFLPVLRTSELFSGVPEEELSAIFSAEAQRIGKYEFEIPFSRQQLADYLAVERSGLSVELGKMRKDGLLDFHKNHFILKV